MITYEESNVWAIDLYPCYKIFSDKYPDKESEMRLAFTAVLSPTSIGRADSLKIIELGRWLINKYVEKE